MITLSGWSHIKHCLSQSTIKQCANHSNKVITTEAGCLVKLQAGFVTGICKMSESTPESLKIWVIVFILHSEAPHPTLSRSVSYKTMVTSIQHQYSTDVMLYRRSLSYEQPNIVF